MSDEPDKTKVTGSQTDWVDFARDCSRVSRCLYTEHSQRFKLCMSVLLQTLTLISHASLYGVILTEVLRHCVCVILDRQSVINMSVQYFGYRIRRCDFMCN